MERERTRVVLRSLALVRGRTEGLEGEGRSVIRFVQQTSRFSSKEMMDTGGSAFTNGNRIAVLESM